LLLTGQSREAQAAAQAAREAAAQAERTLPARVAINGQMLQRQSNAEWNAIMGQYLLGGRANGVITGTVNPPRIVNMPGQPLAP
jgi:hypothetical protein